MSSTLKQASDVTHSPPSTPALAPRFTLAPATPHSERHTIHGYYTGSAESPDGSHVLYYTSATLEGHEGDLRVRDRLTGVETVIAENIVAEDAHRVACQQWASGGRRVVFQNLEHGTWVVGVHDLITGRTTVAARDRHLGWGHASSHLVPLSGLHWDPNSVRDLEFLDLETGEIRVVLRADAVREQYPEWVQRVFGNRPISLYFGNLSPNGKRIFFKVATPAGEANGGGGSSIRDGLLGYDLESERFLFLREKWGHPCWMPNSRHILNVRGAIIDSEDGSRRSLPNWPHISASHPSPSADARQFVTDAGWHHPNDPHIWEILIGNLLDGSSEVVFQFKDGGGAKSWRPPHAHPVFSADGRRIYFNASEEPYTQLHVLERVD